MVVTGNVRRTSRTHRLARSPLVHPPADSLLSIGMQVYGGFLDWYTAYLCSTSYRQRTRGDVMVRAGQSPVRVYVSVSCLRPRRPALHYLEATWYNIIPNSVPDLNGNALLTTAQPDYGFLRRGRS
ncbi:hypothetical protein BV22DRAFT_834426 [Leucogyrophana mollusca]|uniref:Uncharacterized protein n=1 Tax=Leucogyrophana mollusca TaxID=85980 RepID=A0ACB8B3X7_9AGAM|nr:hypothetical protein BV22DRAFT_834426 [Leucogyrophana mollusca]